MTPRPLYRWKSFWLGVFVLGFLGWEWAISHDRLSGGQVVAPAGYFILLAQYNGEVAVQYGRGLFASWRFEKLADIGFTGPQWWPRITLQRNVIIVIQHARLIALFLVPWIAFLAWRWRRMRDHLPTQ